MKKLSQHMTSHLGVIKCNKYEPLCEKTCLWGMRTTKAQASLISAFVICLFESIISRLARSEISIF